MATHPRFWRWAARARRYARRRGRDLRLPLRIPSAFITGSVGKTTTSSMLAAVLRDQGLRVALSTTEVTRIDDRLIREGDSANSRFAIELLGVAPVDAAVFEMARGGLIRQGIGFDRCTVAALLNLHDNHLGLDGITSRAGMAALKARALAPATALVALDGDDPLCRDLAPGLRARQVVLIGAEGPTPALAAHAAKGGGTAWLTGDDPPALHFALKGIPAQTLAASALPATLGGDYHPAALNALFAAVLATGLGVSLPAALASLSRFHSTPDTNPRRMNEVPGRPWRLLVTTVDGPVPTAALAAYVRRTPVTGRRILVLAAVGDRPDPYLRATGAAAAGAFDHYLCVDYTALRGRAPLEAAALLRAGLIDNGVPEARIALAADAEAGQVLAEAMAGPGDFVVIAR